MPNRSILRRLGVLAAGLTVAAAAVQAQDQPGSVAAAPAFSDDGKQVYEEICQACHMADAKGAGGAGAAIPALAGNQNLEDPKFMIDILLHGRGGMPMFGDVLTPGQMTAVINYVRGHFNTYPGTVTEAEVQQALEAG